MALRASSRILLAVWCALVFVLNVAELQSAQTGGNIRKSPYLTGPAQAQSGPLFITGSVVVSDGRPLPMGVAIERVCGDLTKREAYADTNGNFGFLLGAGIVLPDASDSGRLYASELGGGFPGFPTRDAVRTPTIYADCELRAQIAGYRSTSISLDVFRLTGQAAVGTIVLHPVAQALSTTVSVTEMQAPKEARKSLEKAEKELQRKDWKLAQKHLLEALNAYPKFAPAWLRLGQVFALTCRNDDAREAFSKAIAADKNFVPPFVELARLAAQDGSWQEVADLTEHASQVNPLDFPMGFYLNALANLNLGRLDLAEKSVQKAQRIDKQNRVPQTHLLLASILHRKKDHVEEMAQLKDYLRIAHQAADAGRIRYQLQVMELTGHR